MELKKTIEAFIKAYGLLITSLNSYESLEILWMLLELLCPNKLGTFLQTGNIWSYQYIFFNFLTTKEVHMGYWRLYRFLKCLWIFKLFKAFLESSIIFKGFGYDSGFYILFDCVLWETIQNPEISIKSQTSLDVPFLRPRVYFRILQTLWISLNEELKRILTTLGVPGDILSSQ